MLPWETVVPSKSVAWEPAVQAYHHRKLVVPANPYMRVIYNM
jgi:hypothetical protein